MKKQFVLVGLALLLVAPGSALALFGFGVHGGTDIYSVDADSVSFALAYGAEASLVREEITPPIVFGGHFYVDVLPVIDLEISADVAVQQYHIVYQRKTLGGILDEEKEEDATFGRIGIYATIRRDLFVFPPVVHTVAFYAGGGMGVHLITPIISEAFLFDNIGSPEDQLDVDDLIKEATRVGGHLLAGVRIKPPIIPIALSVEAKMTMMREGDYEEPNVFPSIYGKVSFDF
ncbi:MAG: hypothetical protein V1800_16175 [Candidatus Latescibacterota bacterium]